MVNTDNEPSLDAEDPGQPPGDDQGPGLSVVNSASNLSVVFLPLAGPFQSQSLGNFIGPLTLVDPDCVPLQPFMQMKSLLSKVTEIEFRGNPSLLALLKNVMSAFERRQYNVGARALLQFIDLVNRFAGRRLPQEEAQFLTTAARRILNTLPMTDTPGPGPRPGPRRYARKGGTDTRQSDRTDQRQRDRTDHRQRDRTLLYSPHRTCFFVVR